MKPSSDITIESAEAEETVILDSNFGNETTVVGARMVR